MEFTLLQFRVGAREGVHRYVLQICKGHGGILKCVKLKEPISFGMVDELAFQKYLAMKQFLFLGEQKHNN
jgi:hypothetical protein